MTDITFDSINVGDEIPVLTKDPISRYTLALYCGASGDHNPIHVDSDFAKGAGMPDVFCSRHAHHGLPGPGPDQLDGSVPAALLQCSLRFHYLAEKRDQVPVPPLLKSLRRTAKSVYAWRLKPRTRTAMLRSSARQWLHCPD